MHYYDVSPLVVPANQVGEIRIRPRFEHASFPAPELLEIMVCPNDGLTGGEDGQGLSWDNARLEPLEWHLQDDGVLVVKYFFAGEQEFNIRVCISKQDNPQYKPMRSFRVYSLEEDLLSLRPFKGDFHIHTNQSDGKECPCYVAARYRQEGFDFAAISDHRLYEPSQKAAEYWGHLGLDFRLYPGEEVHSPDNPVHIINFGSSFSVNALYRADEAAYRAAVVKRLEEIPREVPGLNYFPVAASEWVFDQIRAGGGLAVFCHPYWYGARNVLSYGLVDAMFKRRRFDALELIGGFFRHQPRSNNFQVVRWCEESAKGNRFPVVGLSDSHGTDLFPLSNTSAANNEGMSSVESRSADLLGWYYTIVFARQNAVPEICSAIRSHNCVAVSHLTGERPEIFGDFRQVRYASFLCREYFPILRHYCQEAGSVMLDYLAGDESLAETIRTLDQRVAAFRNHCFPECR